MSLHRKIIGWFVVFAALTILVFGLGDYIQSARALRFALETRAGSLVLQVVSDVERRYDRAESELLALGHAAAAGGRTAVPAPAHRYTQLQVLREGVLVFEADEIGTVQLTRSGCGTGDVAFDVAFQSAAGVPYRVLARMPVEHFFAGVASAGARLGKQGVSAIMSSTDGTLVFDPGCSIRSDNEFGALAAAISAAVMGPVSGEPGAVLTTALGQRGSSDLILVTVRTAAPPAWTAVASLDYAEFAAPFVKLRRQYFGAMTLVLLSALILGLAGIRSDMRRLAAISQAADAIGRGRFDVWLPPPTDDEIGRVSLALGRMSERLSSSLRQIEVSRSMAAVGELATYLSHEIRNPLSSIRLNLQMLVRDLRKGTVPDDGEQLVGLCLTELQRLDDVVRAVLEVGRTGREATGTCNADAVVEETLRVMQRKLADRGLVVDVALHATDVAVKMDSAALRGVVLNLLLNSADALSGTAHPRIRVTTRCLPDDYGDEPRFELRVSDNGPGVPAHLRDRIFDPFFTTKPKGNGVGLPTALHAVQQCGGMLRYQPSGQWGTGAEFVVELPLVDVKEAAAPVDTPGAAIRARTASRTPVGAGV